MLTSALSWRWIFLVNVPVGVLVMLASIRIVPESRAPDSKRAFDAAGATLVTAGLGVFVFAIVKSESYGWRSGLTWALLVCGLGLIGAFLALERRSSAPLMRLGVFHTPGLGPRSKWGRRSAWPFSQLSPPAAHFTGQQAPAPFKSAAFTLPSTELQPFLVRRC